MKPRIAVTPRKISEGDGQTAIGVKQSYLDSIIAAGGLPYCLPYTDDIDVIRALVTTSDGLLLPGGEDIDPARYGATPHPKLGEVDLKRDMIEFAAYQAARGSGKPVLGICRGIQLINVAQGGTLYQDIDAERVEAAPHRISKWTELSHTMRITEGTTLASCFSGSDVGVNSLHHQAIRELGRELRAIGYSSDGLVEGIEGTSGSFLMAVQCHPEALWQEVNKEWLNFFKLFVKAC